MFIQNLGFNIQRNYMSQHQPSFGKNVVHMWLDSDGTHFPEEDQTKINDPATKTKLNTYFDNFKNFVHDFGKKIRFNLTTGRNRGEYKYYLEILKNAGIDYLPPSKVVFKNGGDLYKNKYTNINDFYNKGLVSDNIDTAKINKIKQSAGWDPDYIRGVVVRTLEDYDFPIIMAPNGNTNYKDQSARNLLKSFDSRVVFVGQDGNLNFYIGLPPTDEGRDLLPKLSKKLREQLDKKAIHYDMQVRDSDWENSNGPIVVIKPKLNGKTLGKEYDIRQAIKKAEKEGDLVVVAGNGSNDKEMLDPETYKDLSSSLDFPLMSIVVGHKDSLRKLAAEHPDKIITVNNAYQLQDGIKEAIDKYSAAHPDFNPYKNK